MRFVRSAVTTAVALRSIEAASLSTEDGFVKNYVNIAKCEDSNTISHSYW